MLEEILKLKNNLFKEAYSMLGFRTHYLNYRKKSQSISTVVLEDLKQEKNHTATHLQGYNFTLNKTVLTESYLVLISQQPLEKAVMQFCSELYN